MKTVLIFLDKREATGLEEYFKQYDCEIQKKMLLVGDMIVSDRICIERKTTNDFISSIIDKRLFKQLTDLKENFEKPLIIIEGNTLYGRLHPNVIRGVLSAIVFDFGIPILWTKDLADTAGLVYWIARKEQLELKREIPLRGKKKALSLKQEQEFLVHGLPNVSIKRSRDILNYFKTPEKVFKASEKELLKVKGVGKGIAKKIKKLLTIKYTEEKKVKK